MKLRRTREPQSADPDGDTNAAGTTAAGTSASARANKGHAQDDVFDKLDPRYKVERKVGEEGSVTNSLAMLTAIPEVDLGMECVPSLLDDPSFLPSSNIVCVLTAIPLPARVCETSKRRKRPSSHSRTAARATATTECQTTRRTSPPRAVRFFSFFSLFCSLLPYLPPLTNTNMRSLPPRVAGKVGRGHHPRCQARSTRAPPGTRGGRSRAFARATVGDGRAGDGAVQEAHAQVSSRCLIGVHLFFCSVCSIPRVTYYRPDLHSAPNCVRSWGSCSSVTIIYAV